MVSPPAPAPGAIPRCAAAVYLLMARVIPVVGLNQKKQHEISVGSEGWQFCNCLISLNSKLPSANQNTNDHGHMITTRSYDR
jgi:hypothetical protein